MTTKYMGTLYTMEWRLGGFEGYRKQSTMPLLPTNQAYIDGVLEPPSSEDCLGNPTKVKPRRERQKGGSTIVSLAGLCS